MNNLENNILVSILGGKKSKPEFKDTVFPRNEYSVGTQQLFVVSEWKDVSKEVISVSGDMKEKGTFQGSKDLLRDPKMSYTVQTCFGGFCHFG